MNFYAKQSAGDTAVRKLCVYCGTHVRKLYAVGLLFSFLACLIMTAFVHHSLNGLLTYLLRQCCIYLVLKV